MEAVADAEKAIEKLDEQIAGEEAKLSPEDAAPDAMVPTDVQEELIRIDHELALLELQAERIKGEIELTYRRNPPSGDKVTEATVTAFVKSNPRLVEAKEACLRKKFERDKANISRRESYRESFATRRAEQMEAAQKPEKTNPRLERLRTKYAEAEMNLAFKERSLEEVKASILPYQLLVQMYTAGVIH